MIAGVVDKKFGVLAMIRTLVVVFFSNMAGAVLIATFVYLAGFLTIQMVHWVLFTIKIAYGKATITPFKAVCSGILAIFLCVWQYLWRLLPKILPVKYGRFFSRFVHSLLEAGSIV